MGKGGGARISKKEEKEKKWGEKDKLKYKENGKLNGGGVVCKYECMSWFLPFKSGSIDKWVFNNAFYTYFWLSSPTVAFVVKKETS